MPAPTQEQVSWNQALGSDRRRCKPPSVPRRRAEQPPRRGPASLPEAFQTSRVRRARLASRGFCSPGERRSVERPTGQPLLVQPRHRFPTRSILPLPTAGPLADVLPARTEQAGLGLLLALSKQNTGSTAVLDLGPKRRSRQGQPLLSRRLLACGPSPKRQAGRGLLLTLMMKASRRRELDRGCLRSRSSTATSVDLLISSAIAFSGLLVARSAVNVVFAGVYPTSAPREARCAATRVALIIGLSSG